MTVSATTVLGLTTFANSDTVDLVAHLSTGNAQRSEDIWTGNAAPAGNLTVDFNNGSDRTVTFKNTGAGVANLALDGTLMPVANDGASLGSTSKQFSDLFLAEGGVINWDNGDATLTQTNNVLALDGAGFTIATGAGFAVGTTAPTNRHIATGGAVNTPTINEFGIDATVVSSGTTNTALLAAFRASITTPNTAYTLAEAAGLLVLPSVKGAANSITTIDGVAIQGDTTACTNKFGINVGTLGGGTALNAAIKTSVGPGVMIGGGAARSTTQPTNQIDLYDGVAPVGTLANGVTFYSASGEARVMDAAGNSTLLSPHDHETNEWIFWSKHSVSGKVLRIDMERMARFINTQFGGDFIHEWEEAVT